MILELNKYFLNTLSKQILSKKFRINKKNRLLVSKKRKKMFLKEARILVKKKIKKILK